MKLKLIFLLGFVFVNTKSFGQSLFVKSNLEIGYFESMGRVLGNRRSSSIDYQDENILVSKIAPEAGFLYEFPKGVQVEMGFSLFHFDEPIALSNDDLVEQFYYDLRINFGASIPIRKFQSDKLKIYYGFGALLQDKYVAVGGKNDFSGTWINRRLNTFFLSANLKMEFDFTRWFKMSLKSNAIHSIFHRKNRMDLPEKVPFERTYVDITDWEITNTVNPTISIGALFGIYTSKK
ncbi:MAG: hypothetical protein KDC24_11190 [Saprospiraceae bacterium]|nr:hypothetical protein [Saprospiraceae bacterium]